MSTVTDLESYQQFALQQQAQNNAWSAEQAAKQMDFQREMSNTAHQREVADLQAAGLNPVLSANSGASVPNGAAGQPDNSAAANVGQILQQVLSAQSAREVAGMYNAATIAAAQIAAGANMYATDQNNKTKRENPESLWGAAARVVNALQTDQQGLRSTIVNAAKGVTSSGIAGLSGVGDRLQLWNWYRKNFNNAFILPFKVGTAQYQTAMSLFKAGKYTELYRFMSLWRNSHLRK